jgi:sulfite exporter TauE/SafE
VAWLFVPFFGGLAGSLHCVGMCGVFPLTLRHGEHPVRRQLLYNLGRLNTLALIGTASGMLGATIAAYGPFRAGARWLALGAGGAMVVVGLELLGVLRHLTARGATLVQSTLGRALAGTLRSPSLAAPLALGVLNAFLPCQLVYAFAAQAASTGSPLMGSIVMITFGLGTVPAMLTLGVAGTRAHARVRLRLQRTAAVLVVGVGLLTMLRGTGMLDALHLHH